MAYTCVPEKLYMRVRKYALSVYSREGIRRAIYDCCSDVRDILCEGVKSFYDLTVDEYYMVDAAVEMVIDEFY